MSVSIEVPVINFTQDAYPPRYKMHPDMAAGLITALSGGTWALPTAYIGLSQQKIVDAADETDYFTNEWPGASYARLEFIPIDLTGTVANDGELEWSILGAGTLNSIFLADTDVVGDPNLLIAMDLPYTINISDGSGFAISDNGLQITIKPDLIL